MLRMRGTIFLRIYVRTISKPEIAIYQLWMLWGEKLLYQDSRLLAYAKGNMHFGRVRACLRIHLSVEPTVETKVMELDIVVRIGQVHWYVSSLRGRLMQCHIELFCDEERGRWEKEVFISWSNCLMSKNLELWDNSFTIGRVDVMQLTNNVFDVLLWSTKRDSQTVRFYGSNFFWQGDNHKKKK